MTKFIHLPMNIITMFILIFVMKVNSLPTDIPQIQVILNDAPIVVNNPGGCLVDADCNGHGQCINKTECVCYRGWTTYGNTGNANAYCTYEQRSKQTAFFLSFFLGALGIDWFYLSRGTLGYIIVGIVKLLLSCGCCSAWPLTYFGPELQNSESVKKKLRGVGTLFSLLAFAWWIVDWSRILSNRFPDGRGAALMPW